ncbi:MAG: hypothetical protein VXW79_01415, partial [Bacteroidota bacterium]|nr:hypothetical protein [Bacteroidota bacterium]
MCSYQGVIGPPEVDSRTRSSSRLHAHWTFRFQWLTSLSPMLGLMLHRVGGPLHGRGGHILPGGRSGDHR